MAQTAKIKATTTKAMMHPSDFLIRYSCKVLADTTRIKRIWIEKKDRDY
jgi:hypothetical protein